MQTKQALVLCILSIATPYHSILRASTEGTSTAHSQQLSSLLTSSVGIPGTVPGQEESPLLPITLRQLGPDGRIQQLSQDIRITAQEAGMIAEGGAWMHTLLHNPAINALKLEGPHPDYVQRIDDRKEHLRAIVHIMWYLYSEAINKHEAFIEGSFIILDPDFKLYNFLMLYARRYNPDITGQHDPLNHATNNPFACSRDSSHWKSSQAHWSHYGIDIRQEEDQPVYNILPTGKPHLLFGIVGENPNRLFIKFEDHGLYTGGGVRNPTELLGHAWYYVVSRVRKQQKVLPPAVYQQLIEPCIGSDEGDDIRKEHTSTAFTQRCGEILRDHPNSRTYYNSLEQNGMAKLTEYIDHKPADWSQELHTAFKDYYAELKDTYDYTDIRKGCEVILGRDELLSSTYFHCFASGDQELGALAGILYETRRKQRILCMHLTALNHRIEHILRTPGMPVPTELIRLVEGYAGRLQHSQGCTQRIAEKLAECFSL
jgi:hypothetical protein